MTAARKARRAALERASLLNDPRRRAVFQFFRPRIEANAFASAGHDRCLGCTADDEPTAPEELFASAMAAGDVLGRTISQFALDPRAPLPFCRVCTQRIYSQIAGLMLAEAQGVGFDACPCGPTLASYERQRGRGSHNGYTHGEPPAKPVDLVCLGLAIGLVLAELRLCAVCRAFDRGRVHIDAVGPS